MNQRCFLLSVEHSSETATCIPGESHFYFSFCTLGFGPTPTCTDARYQVDRDYSSASLLLLSLSGLF